MPWSCSNPQWGGRWWIGEVKDWWTRGAVCLPDHFLIRKYLSAVKILNNSVEIFIVLSILIYFNLIYIFIIFWYGFEILGCFSFFSSYLLRVTVLMDGVSISQREPPKGIDNNYLNLNLNPTGLCQWLFSGHLSRRHEFPTFTYFTMF